MDEVTPTAAAGKAILRPGVLLACSVETFPIEQNAEVADRLHVLVDDWGQWRSASEPPERKWLIYSERANAVLLHSVLYGHGYAGRKWESTDVKVLIHMNGSQFDLVIKAEQLAPLRAFMADFDVWQVD